MLNQIQKGKIEIFNKDISKLGIDDLESLKLNFSYLFQFGALYSFLNVIENISVMLKEYKFTKRFDRKIAYTNLDIVGLPKHTAKLYPSELSGGMKKELPLHEVLQCNQNFYFGWANKWIRSC